MDERVIEVLQKAKEKVAEGWCQGALARWSDGRVLATGPIDAGRLDTAAAVCVSGAIQNYVGTTDNHLEALAFMFLQLAIRDGAACWNDAPGRTQVEVLDAFDAAIRLAKDTPA